LLEARAIYRPKRADFLRADRHKTGGKIGSDRGGEVEKGFRKLRRANTWNSERSEGTLEIEKGGVSNRGRNREEEGYQWTWQKKGLGPFEREGRRRKKGSWDRLSEGNRLLSRTRGKGLL